MVESNTATAYLASKSIVQKCKKCFQPIELYWTGGCVTFDISAGGLALLSAWVGEDGGEHWSYYMICNSTLPLQNENKLSFFLLVYKCNFCIYFDPL